MIISGAGDPAPKGGADNKTTEMFGSGSALAANRLGIIAIWSQQLGGTEQWNRTRSGDHYKF